MAAQVKRNPPFRAEHIGSFVRPERLLQAARARQAGTIPSEVLVEVADQSIVEIVRFQESLGMPSVTDGEFRRRSWSAGFIDAVEGFGLREGTIEFRTQASGKGAALSPYAKARLRRHRAIAADEFAFLKSVIRRGTPKTTMPAPDVMHYFLGPRAVDDTVYPEIEQFFEDLARIYREEIAELAERGCSYLQIDDTALPCNCDEHIRQSVKQRGEDPDALTARYVQLLNKAIGARPANMMVGVHLCRGNLKGTWMAEGGYEPIAEMLFNEADVDAFFLEFDTARAGDFTPLRHVPPSKFVVLGLVSSKAPVLESKDEIKRRIDEAARFIDLDRLGLSPQCGFSSGGGSGQTVGHDDERRKLQLVLDVAHEVWGETS
jgi:5-methyltetrahydropteroyltriglutamate--homocysteine methyltransferase